MAATSSSIGVLAAPDPSSLLPCFFLDSVCEGSRTALLGSSPAIFCVCRLQFPSLRTVEVLRQKSSLFPMINARHWGSVCLATERWHGGAAALQ